MSTPGFLFFIWLEDMNPLSETGPGISEEWVEQMNRKFGVYGYQQAEMEDRGAHVMC